MKFIYCGLRKAALQKKGLAMQRQSVCLRLLMAATVLLLIGCRSGADTARPEANSTIGLKPVASFDFANANKLGEDAILHDGKSTVVGRVRQADSPFGCAAEFNGEDRISVDTNDILNFNRSFSATTWVNGSGTRFRTLERASMRGSSFQVVGDKIYFVTNSDPSIDGSYSGSVKGAFHYRSAIWSGVADVNLGSWNDQQRTKPPLSGLEPKLQVVGSHLFFEYFGGDAGGNWHIYTGTSGTDGKDWVSSQRTFANRGYASEQSLNIQVVGDKAHYAFPLKDENGKWQLWTATSNVDGSSWKALQQTMKGGFVPSFRVSGDKIYYIFLSGTAKDKVRGDFKNDVIIASSNLDGSGWREIRRIHDAAWLVAQLTVDKDTIHYSFSKRDSSGNAHLWTGRVSVDGSSPLEHQRTFGTGNAAPALVQVVGDKVLYAFSATKQPVASKFKVGSMGMSFWTASTDLDGDHWIQRREIGGDGDDYGYGYKMLGVGGKSYYDLTKLYYVGSKVGVVRYENAILAYSGSNILNKGDSYGIGMSASGSVSGFVNAGEDYLYRGEAPKDVAGALVEQELASGWHHVAVTYDGNILRLYVDGKLARETRYDKKPAANPFPLSIGDGFVGKIARVMLFDRALDQSEVAALAIRHQSSCRLAAGSP